MRTGCVAIVLLGAAAAGRAAAGAEWRSARHGCAVRIPAGDGWGPLKGVADGHTVFAAGTGDPRRVFMVIVTPVLSATCADFDRTAGTFRADFLAQKNARIERGRRIDVDGHPWYEIAGTYASQGQVISHLGRVTVAFGRITNRLLSSEFRSN